MGMAASQARLLSITSRMADNELKAQIINNSKMRLATESSRVSENYINALNSATMMFTNYNTEGDSQYQKLTFNSLTAFSPYNNQYALINPNGQILVSETEDALYKAAIGTSDPLKEYLKSHGLEYKTTYFDDNSACPDQFAIQSLNSKNQVYDVKTYSKDYLKDAYERYNENLQSSKYEEFTNLYNNYSLKSALLTGAVATSMQETLINSPFNNGSVNTGDQTFSDKMKALLSTIDKSPEQQKSDAKQAYDLLVAMARDCANKGYLPITSQLYKDITGSALRFNADNNVVISTDNFPVKKEKNTQNGFQLEPIYEFGQVKDDLNGTSYPEFYLKPVYEMVTENGKVTGYTFKNQYKFEMNENLDGRLNLEFTPPEFSSPLQNSISFKVVEKFDQKDSDNNELPTIENEYTYKMSDVNTESPKVTCTTIVENSTEINYAVNDLYQEFMADYIYFMQSGFADNYDIENSDKKDIKDKNEALKEASDALMQFIFGTGTSLKAKDLAGHLDDIPWLIANYGNQFSEDFKLVEEIFVLDQLFDEFGEPAYGWVDNNNPTADADAKVTWYTNLFERMQKGYRALEDGLASSNTWIQFALESGIATMEQVDKTNKWVGTLHTNCSDISEVTDDVAVARAEVEYKKAMNNIENKDKRFDIELKNIDTEHNSLQKEYESVKKVIDKNIQRTFKMYS